MSSITEERDKEAKAPDVVFRGIDGSECEAFIFAIQDFAFAKGLDEDHHWMLRFARTRLKGKALRWYATLDPSIQNDWYLFVKALFDQYPLADELGVAEAEIATPIRSTTTFSPAPSTVALPSNPVADRNATGLKASVLPTRQYDPSSTGQLGLLRVVIEEGTTSPQYVWWVSASEEEGLIVDRGINSPTDSYASPKRTTPNRHEALVVSFLPSSNPHSIGCVNPRGRMKTLVIQCDHTGASGVGYTLYGCTNNHHILTNPRAQWLDYVATIWNFLADGTLQASLSSFSRNVRGVVEESKFSTTEVHVNTSGDTIRFAKPGTPLGQGKAKGTFIHPFVRARIVFEPL